MEVNHNNKEISKQKNLTAHNSCQNSYQHDIIKSFIKIHKKSQATSLAGSIARQTLNFIIILQNFICLLLITNSSLKSDVFQVILSIKTKYSLYWSLQIFLLMCSCTLIVVIVTSTRTHIYPILQITRVHIIRNFRLLASINFIVITLLSYVDFLQHIHLLFCGTLILIFTTLVVENYYFKQNNNYQSEIVTSLKHATLHIFTATINALIFNLQDQFSYCIFNVFSSSLLIIWHVKGGSTLYFSKNLSFSLIFIDSISISIGIVCLIRLIGLSSIVSVILELTVSSIFTAFFLFQNRQHLQYNLLSTKFDSKQQKIKDFQLQIIQVLQDSENDIDLDTIVLGQMRYQAEKYQSNSLYFLNQRQLYIPYYKIYVSPTSIVRQKHYLFMYFLRFIYEQSIKNLNSTKTRLDYCEFMINYFQDTSIFYHLLQLQNQNELGLIDRIKIINMKLILQQKSQAMNKLLFGGRVQLLEVLKAERTYEEVSLKIDQYCDHNILIRQQLLNGKLKQTQFNLNVNKNSQNVQIIDEKWKQLSVFFHLQKLWKFMYLSYSFFIKNKKMKKNQILLQQNLVNQPKTLNPQSVFKKFFDNKTNDLIFFANKSAIFSTEFKQNQLYFVYINNRFQELFQFSNNQIKGSPLSLIISNKYREAHRVGFLKWMKNGQYLDEKNYKIKISQVLTRDGQQKSVGLFFKIYINLSQLGNDINFICLLNLNKNQDIQQSQLGLSQKSISDKIPLRKSQTLKQSYFQRNNSEKLGENNIFIKEDQLKPVQTHRNMKCIKKAIRLTSILSIIFTLISLSLLLEKVNYLRETVAQTYFFVNSYRCPMGLMTNYIRLSLEIGNQTKLKNQIKTLNILMRNISTNSTFIKILSDPFLNVPGLYYPLAYNNVNKGIVYDQIDIFYVIYSSLTSMAQSSVVNRTSQAFIQLDSYLKPAYDLMINGTKLKFYQKMLILVHKIEMMQYFLMVAVSINFILAVIYIWSKTKQYYQNMEQFFLILVQTDKKSLLQALNFWHSIKQYFNRLNQKETLSNKLTLKKSKKSKQLQLASIYFNQKNLGGRQKNTIQIEQQEYNIWHFIIKFMFLLLFLVCLLANHILNIKEMQSFQVHMGYGYDVLWHYPNCQLVSYALSDRYYSQVYPNQTTYNFSRFEDSLSNFNSMTQHIYISTGDPSSLYLQKSKNYLNGNPCTFNPAIHQAAGYTLQECEGFANNTLRNGITTFLSYLKTQINNFLSPNSNLLNYQKQYIVGLANSLSLGAAYFTDMLQTWLNQLQANLDITQQINKYGAIAICVTVIVIHLVIIEWSWLGTLEQYFDHMRNIYLNFIPCPMIHKQKLVKQRLYETGMLPFAGNS